MRQSFGLLIGCFLLVNLGGIWAEEPPPKGAAASIRIVKPAATPDDLYESSDVVELTEALRHPNYQRREIAARRLGTLGKSARSAIPALFLLLQDKDEFVRRVAVSSLLALGAPNESLLPLLHDPDNSIRLAVARDFVKRRQHTSDALETLVVLATQKRKGYDYSNMDAGEALKALGAKEARLAIPLLLAKYGDVDKQVRDDAVRLVRDMAPFIPDAMSEIVPLLSDERHFVRQTAAESLEDWSAMAETVAPRLRELLTDADDEVAMAAATTLYSIEPESMGATDVIMEALSNSSAKRRYSGLSAVYDRGATNDAMLCALLPRIEDEDPDVRKFAQLALGDSPSLGRDVLRDLLEADRSADVRELATRLARRETSELANSLLTLSFRDPAVEVRLAAAAVAMDLSHLSPDNAALLEKSLQDPAAKLRIAAARALIRHRRGSPEILRLLLTMLKREDGEEVRDVVEAIGEMKSAAAPAVPVLIEALSDPKWVEAGIGADNVNIWIARSLGEIGQPALPGLIATLGHPDIEVRGRAAEALKTMGPLAAAAVPELIGRLKDLKARRDNMGCMVFDKTMQADAVQALGRIGPAAGPAVPHLIPLLKSKREEEIGESDRIDVAMAFGRIGKEANDGLPALREVAKVDHLGLLLVSTEAIAAIDPTDESIVPNLRLFIDKLLNDEDGGSGLAGTTELFPSIVKTQGARAQSLKPVLATMISDTPLLMPRHRAVAAWALLYIDPQNETALQYLRRASKHPDWLLAEFAAEGLAEFEKPSTVPKN